MTITTDGRLALNADAGDVMRSVGARFIQLLWDPDARKFALRPVAKGDEHAYRLTPARAHKRGMYLSATAFLRHIGWDFSTRRTMAVEWNEKRKMLEVHLPASRGTGT